MSSKETAYPALVMPDTVERKSVTIWSDGVALDADVYRPKGLSADQRVPGVVLSHGWGGSKLTGERYAAKFAAAGMVSLCFTHGGWFGSGRRVVLAGNPPLPGDDDDIDEGMANVRVIRDVIDPIEWLQNQRCAIDYIEGEPNVDPSRIGSWGTSFGGGIAMHNAANDDRVKVLAVQVASLASVLKGPLAQHARQRAIDTARGAIASVPQGIDAYPPLAGTPHLARFLQYDAIREVPKIKVPTLMLDAGNEELFDIRENGRKAFEMLRSKDTAPAEYRVIDGIDHYGIYFAGFDEGSEAALAWFAKYL